MQEQITGVSVRTRWLTQSVQDLYYIKGGRLTAVGIKLAKWLGWLSPAQERLKQVVFDRSAIDTHAIIGRVLQQRYVYELMYDQKATRIMIGAWDYGELVAATEWEGFKSIRVVVPLDGHAGRRLMDMEIVIVPWVRGVVVLP